MVRENFRLQKIKLTCELVELFYDSVAWFAVFGRMKKKWKLNDTVSVN